MIHSVFAVALALVGTAAASVLPGGKVVLSIRGGGSGEILMREAAAAAAAASAAVARADEASVHAATLHWCATVTSGGPNAPADTAALYAPDANLWGTVRLNKDLPGKIALGM